MEHHCILFSIVSYRMKNLLEEVVIGNLLIFKSTLMILAVAVEEAGACVALVLEVEGYLETKILHVLSVEKRELVLMLLGALLVVVVPKAANLVSSLPLALMIGMIFRLWLLFKSPAKKVVDLT